MIRKLADKTDPGGETCPLCQSADTHDFCADKRRRYVRCGGCHLVFVPPAYYLSEAEEKQRYDIHQNNPADSGYRKFLSRTFLPMQARLAPGSRGLDFGSGPGPTLSLMFQEAGHQVALYDHFYAPDASVFAAKYDFITATEVLEHLHHPLTELERLWQCLKPGGTLGIMTKLVLDRDAFATWHYKNDLTHVCFFSKSTLRWVARRWQAEIEFIDKDVVFFYK
jgi:SAM-dependent methyltransferase